MKLLHTMVDHKKVQQKLKQDLKRQKNNFMERFVLPATTPNQDNRLTVPPKQQRPNYTSSGTRMKLEDNKERFLFTCFVQTFRLEFQRQLSLRM